MRRGFSTATSCRSGLALSIGIRHRTIAAMAGSMRFAEEKMTDPARYSTIVGPRVSSLVICSAGWVALTTICFLVWSDSPTPSERVLWVIAAAGQTCLLLAMGSARIVASSDMLILRNIFLDISIPIERILQIDALNGVVVETDEGEFESTAYGTSVLASLRTFRSARAADQLLEAWLHRERKIMAATTRNSRRTRRSLRRWWVVVTPMAMLSSLLLGLALVAIVAG
jgi:hypothetical protein